MVTADLPYVGLRSFVNKSHFALKKADGAVDQTDEETLSPTTGCGASIAHTQGRERKGGPIRVDLKLGERQRK